MTSKKIDWRIVWMALIPALGVSIALTLIGGTIGLSESAVDRGAQTLFFPIFLGAYHYHKRRRTVTPA